MRIPKIWVVGHHGNHTISGPEYRVFHGSKQKPISGFQTIEEDQSPSKHAVASQLQNLTFTLCSIITRINKAKDIKLHKYEDYDQCD